MSLSVPRLFIVQQRNTFEKTLVFILDRRLMPKVSIKLHESLRIRTFHQGEFIRSSFGKSEVSGFPTCAVGLVIILRGGGYAVFLMN